MHRSPPPSLSCLGAAAPSHTDPGSAGRHSWHQRGTARCPVSSGQWAAAPARSPARPPRNDFYIHTSSCPVGREEKIESPFSRIPGHTSAPRATIQHRRYVEGPRIIISLVQWDVLYCYRLMMKCHSLRLSSKAAPPERASRMPPE